MLKSSDKKKILKSVCVLGEGKHARYKRTAKITDDFLSDTIVVRAHWNNIYKVKGEKPTIVNLEFYLETSEMKAKTLAMQQKQT